MKNNTCAILFLSMITFLSFHPSFAQEQDTTKADEITVIGRRPKIHGHIDVDSIIAATSIQKVKLITTPCYGTCAVFSAEFNNDGTALYNGEHYTELEGIYKADFYQRSFVDICEYIRFAKIEKLDDDYSIPVSDLPSTIIEIHYKDGKVKSTRKYGNVAPVEFDFLETHLRYLVTILKWEKVDE